MTYSEDEIRTAVSSVMRTTVRRQIDSLGARKLSVTYSDMQEAAAGMFILDQTAAFYVIYLAAQRLLTLVETEAALVSTLIQAANAAGRDVLPIENTAPLYNARSAIFDLEKAVSVRTQGLKDITALPAYVRFEANISKFLSEYGGSVKQDGQIVDTPRGAKNYLRANLPVLQAAYTDIATRAGYVLKALEDYSALSLPVQVGGSVINKSRELVTRITTSLEAASPGARQELMRDAVLGLLTAKSAVKGVGTFTVPDAFYDVEGTATPYSDTNHLAEPAKLVADIYAPYNVASGDSLDIAVDGASPVTIGLSTAVYPRAEGLTTDTMSFAANVLGTRIGPYYFVASKNDVFVAFLFDAVTREYKTLTVSWTGSKTVGTVVTDINTAIGVLGLGAYYAAQNTGGAVELYSLGVGDDYRIAIGSGSANAPLGFTTTGGIYVEAPAYAHLVCRTQGPYNTVGNEYFEFFVNHPGTNKPVRIQVTVTSGAAVTAPTIALDIMTAVFAAKVDAYYTVTASGAVFSLSSGATGREYSIAIGSGDLNAIVGFDIGDSAYGKEAHDTLSIAVDGYLGSPFAVTLNGGNQTARTIATTIDAILPADFEVDITGAEDARAVYVKYIGASPSAFSSKLRFLPSNTSAAATLGFITSGPYRGRSLTARLVAQDINNRLPDSVKASTEIDAVTGAAPSLARTDILDPTKVVLYRWRGTATASSPAANTIRLTGVSLAYFEVGNIVAIRDGVNVDSKWTVTAVTATYVDATGAFTPMSGSCYAEVGYNFGVVPGYVIRIEDGVSKGTYEIVTVGPGALAVPFEFAVDAALAAYNSATPSLFNATLGQEKITVASKNTTISSALEIDGVAAPLFFSTVPATAVAYTTWIQLPTTVRGLQKDDTVKLYTTNGVVPATVHTITSVEATRISISPSVPVDASLNFYADTLPPFIRLGNTLFDDYSLLKSRLTVALAKINANTFKEISRAANVLLVQPNPTKAQVNDLVGALTYVQEALVQAGSPAPTETFEYALTEYSTAQNPDVDALLAGFVEKGASRAVDILTQGKFSEFFGLSFDDSSYAGALSKAMQAVVQNDMPARKVGRSDAYVSRISAQQNSPDYEYDTSDTEISEVPDTPGVMEQDTPGIDPIDF